MTFIEFSETIFSLNNLAECMMNSARLSNIIGISASEAYKYMDYSGDETMRKMSV